MWHLSIFVYLFSANCKLMKTAEIGSKEQRGLRTNTVYELNYNNYGQKCPSPSIG